MNFWPLRFEFLTVEILKIWIFDRLKSKIQKSLLPKHAFHNIVLISGIRNHINYLYLKWQLFSQKNISQNIMFLHVFTSNIWKIPELKSILRTIYNRYEHNFCIFRNNTFIVLILIRSIMFWRTLNFLTVTLFQRIIWPLRFEFLKIKIFF